MLNKKKTGITAGGDDVWSQVKWGKRRIRNTCRVLHIML